MAGIVYDLIDVLDEQRECYEGLITLADYKKDAIVSKNLDILQQVVNREEQFVGRLHTLENKRELLMKDISIVTGINYKEITVTTIINKIGEQNEASIQLAKLKKQILDLVGPLKRKSELNKELISQSLELVEFMINAIGSTKGYCHVGNYSKGSGMEMNYERQQSVFDHKQ